MIKAAAAFPAVMFLLCAASASEAQPAGLIAGFRQNMHAASLATT